MIIGRYEVPKQKATRHYGFLLIEAAGIKDADRYSILTVDLKTGAEVSGSYKLTASEAWKCFHQKIQENSIFGPETWERTNDN